MENKYYTPAIEEFHVGFEYEILHNNEWKKTSVFNNSCGGDIIFEIKNMGHWDVVSKPRVKYLDKEDIESLGWRPNLRNTSSFWLTWTRRRVTFAIRPAYAFRDAE
jgi:hypothetical protein